MLWRRWAGVCCLGVGIWCEVEDETEAFAGGDTLVLLLLLQPVYAAAVVVLEAACGDGPWWESISARGQCFGGWL